VLKEESQRLADVAYRNLLRRILTHEMPGGSIIQERKLAEAMAISRTPMRDAIVRLEGEGLLIRLTDRLIAVRVITLTDYLQSLDVRRLIEPTAAALATAHLVPQDFTALDERLARLADEEDLDLTLHWDLDDALHDTIAEKSGNVFLAKTVREMRRYTKIFESQMVPARRKPGFEDHREIVDALRSGKPDRARDAMAAHLRNVRKRALDGL